MGTPKPAVKWIILLIVVVLGLTACASAQARTRPTRTPTPTPRPRATFTPVPTVTPTPLPESACPLPDLGSGQHISASGSYTQTQTEAAGGMVCRIQPDTCAHHQLVGNLDASIVFKREEQPPFDKEDILMHPAMILPLYRLSQLVLAEWPGVYRLRVTDAYDSLLEHDLGQPDENLKISLHFEGRAVDVTTWPTDPQLYPRLCTLAHCAGFAWVHNEGDHCHAAINADSLCLKCSQ